MSRLVIAHEQPQRKLRMYTCQARISELSQACVQVTINLQEPTPTALHWAINDWQLPPQQSWPTGTQQVTALSEECCPIASGIAAGIRSTRKQSMQLQNIADSMHACTLDLADLLWRADRRQSRADRILRGQDLASGVQCRQVSIQVCPSPLAPGRVL